MKNYCVAIILLSLTIISCSQDSPVDGLFFGQTPPGLNPVVFASGIISEEQKNSHALVFSPDGKTMVFSRYPDKTSYMITIEKGKWSTPVETSFLGKEVSFSPNGEKIYFYTEGDIFCVEKETSGWSEPKKLPSTINTSEQVEYYPCLVGSGSIYFSRNPNWKGARTMYSRFKDGQFEEAIDIGSTINNGGASHAWVSPDETFMLFNSPREGSYTRNDIWVSFRNNDETWQEPINLGEEINSGADAVLCPTVSPDGKYLFFTRLTFGEQSHTGLIYWVSTEIIDRVKKE